jgi:hypothetical protein
MGIRSFMHPSDGLSGFEPRTADARSGGPGVSGLRLLPSPVPLDCYELRGVIAEGAAAIVYLGTDLTLRVPVAIREYMPQGLAWRDATSRVLPLSPAQEIPFTRGLQAFIDEARTLARCDHPSLLRIVRLLEANATAYSVMPHYVGRRLTDVRRDAKAAYDEQQLRALLAELLGALEAFHAFGSVHGGVSPDNILLLQNGRPVLLRPRAQSRETSGESIDTLTGYMNNRSEPEAASVGSATGPWTDLRDAARVIRFLMVGEWAGHHSLTGGRGGSSRDGADGPSLTGPQAHYSRSLLEALDAAESLLPERRPRSVAEFREWLKEARPSEPAVAGARRHDSAAPADDVSVRESQENTVPAVALASGAPELPEPERGLAPERTPDVDPAPTAEPCIAAAAAPLPTPPTARRAEGDPPAETVDREIPAIAKSHRDLRTRRMALKSAVVLGILAVPAMGTWLLNRPPVEIQGWSRALAPPSLTPSRNAPNSVAVATPRLPEAASQAASGALESGGAFTGTAPDGVRSAAPAVGDLAADRAPLTSPTTPEPPTAPENSGVLPQLGDTDALSTPVAPEAPPSPATAAPVPQSTLKQGSPRKFCAPRTQFALYRCMQTQCRHPRWSHHAECIRLRATNDVD